VTEKDDERRSEVSGIKTNKKQNKKQPTKNIVKISQFKKIK